MRSMLLLLLAALTGCAVGVTPPADTPMALIDDGLLFQFGSEAPCASQAPEEDPCIGTTIYNSSERHPQLWVQLSPFSVDVHEVTNIQYEYCEAMGACPKHNIVNAVASSQAKYHLTDEFDDHPVVQVTYAQAEAYCAFLDKRLPTEFEWERVARGNPDAQSGPTSRLYPAEGIGSSVLNCKSPLKLPTKYCTDDEIEVAPTQALLDGGLDEPTDHVIEESATGNKQTIYHLFGNVAEWTSSFHQADITCQNSAYTGACQPCWDCGEDTDCKATCSDCPDCPKGDCSYVCGESDTSYFQCQSQASSQANPVKPEDLEPTTGAKRVIRGGSVFDGTNKGCYARSAARDRVGDSGSLTPDRTQPYVGFRCVK